MGRRGRRTRAMVTTATGRMRYLMDYARSEAGQGRMHQAHRCVDLAWRIGLRYNIRLGQMARDEFCRKCRSYLVPGRNIRIRLSRGNMIRTCLECGHIRRIPMETSGTAPGGGDHHP